MRKSLKDTLRNSEEQIFDYSEIPSSSAVLESVSLPVVGKDQRKGKLAIVAVCAVLLVSLGLSFLHPDVRAFTVSLFARPKVGSSIWYIDYGSFLPTTDLDNEKMNSLTYRDGEYVLIHFFEPATENSSLFFDKEVTVRQVNNDSLGIPIIFLTDETGSIAKFTHQDTLHTIYSNVDEADFADMMKHMKLRRD